LLGIGRRTKTYWDDFIPFAHGVRRLAVYYNDAVRPRDPYEFVGLLQGEDLLATRRNSTLRSLAHRLRHNAPLRDAVRRACHSTPAGVANWQDVFSRLVRATTGGEEFLAEFQQVLESSLDLAYGNTRLADRPDWILQTVLEMSHAIDGGDPRSVKSETETRETLRQRLLTAVGPDRQEEALETLEIGRLSWRLRDNDNLLLARVESQLLRATDLAAARLKSTGRLARDAKVTKEAAERIMAALRDQFAGEVVLPEEPKTSQVTESARPNGTPRQLIGQPAAPGLESGKVRCIRSGEDLGRFQAGEVLVCDAIRPMMTHLVPLAAAIVERRGGMLIHVHDPLYEALRDYMERSGDTLKLKRFEAPTSVENLAHQLFSEISSMGFRLERLEVQETDTSEPVALSICELPGVTAQRGEPAIGSRRAGHVARRDRRKELAEGRLDVKRAGMSAEDQRARRAGKAFAAEWEAVYAPALARAGPLACLAVASAAAKAF